MKRNLIIIIGLILFVIGAGIGFVLGFGARFRVVDIPPSLQEKTVRTLIGYDAVDSICANLIGEVTEIIDENRIIITHNYERLELKINPDAHIVRSTPPEKPGAPSISTIIKLNEIQLGEQVDIYAVITEQGEIVARGITVQLID